MARLSFLLLFDHRASAAGLRESLRPAGVGLAWIPCLWRKTTCWASYPTVALSLTALAARPDARRTNRALAKVSLCYAATHRVKCLCALSSCTAILPSGDAAQRRPRHPNTTLRCWACRRPMPTGIQLSASLHEGRSERVPVDACNRILLMHASLRQAGSQCLRGLRGDGGPGVAAQLPFCIRTLPVTSQTSPVALLWPVASPGISLSPDERIRDATAASARGASVCS